MNKRQKEIFQSQLNDEQAVINDLKKIYKKSLNEIDDKIAQLLGREDTENLQSIIYQVEYQKALKQQIGGILDTLNGEQFNSISDYLSKCYNEGFLSTMYDLHGQNIPLIFPIDQKQIVAAVQHETKLSKSLYSTLGEDVSKLKKNISGSISRGIAQGSSYADISRDIARSMVGDYSKMRGGALSRATTIARTEGHRITQKSTFDAQQKAKSLGADIFKQWDASLDARTRESHAMMNGKIVEVDKKFPNGLLYPGDPAGPASEVINCRCIVTQRARWALDKEELKRLQDEAEFFGLDKTDDFEAFKTKYLKVSGKITEYEKEINDLTHRLLQKATAAEPKITKDLYKIVKNTNGTIDYHVENGASALDFKLKTENSLKRKIKSDFLDGRDLDYIERHMFDNVRYTDLVDKQFLVADYGIIQKQLEANGYKTLRVKNTLGDVNAAYRGLNTVVESPDGYKFELQFHTPESIDIKERVHKLYEISRLDSTPAAEKLKLTKEMKEISSQLPEIKNIDSIKSFSTIK